MREVVPDLQVAAGEAMEIAEKEHAAHFTTIARRMDPWQIRTGPKRWSVSRDSLPARGDPASEGSPSGVASQGPQL